ncbi:hypothetical protein [Lutibacter sp. HS1-25]|uniref:hypothetical protein n=1 Tax=Lutibacter sp. HS1-25 TaxID=2485000 RepID=UPI0010110587|nr:hypothetical protein [Lutibacter sp. HS1-25]
MQGKFYFTLLLFFLCSNIFSQQGNYKFNNYGNSSMLLSGNVTGSVEDIALTYYNPARLTELQSTKFAFNAQAYQASSYKLSNLSGDQSSISDNNFDGVPSIAGGTFNLFGTRFAYAVLSKSRVNIDLNYTSNFENNEPLDVFDFMNESTTKTSLNNKIKDDWLGLTWAKKINEKLSLGISGFASIYKESNSTHLNFVEKIPNDGIAFYNSSVGFKQESYGLFFKLGANYQFSKFELGLNMNLPYLEIYNKGKYNYTNIIAGVNPENDKFYDYNFKDLESDRKVPLGISIGAGVPVKKSKLHLNLDYIFGLNAYNRLTIPQFETGNEVLTTVLFEEKRNGVFNFGAGFEIFMTEKISSFISFSTDLNSIENNANDFILFDNGELNNNFNENLIHFGLGIDSKLKWGNIVFGTTLTNGSSRLNNVNKPLIDSNTKQYINLKYNRWQFIIGIEIPFLNDKLKEVTKKLI